MNDDNWESEKCSGTLNNYNQGIVRYQGIFGVGRGIRLSSNHDTQNNRDYNMINGRAGRGNGYNQNYNLPNNYQNGSSNGTVYTDNNYRLPGGNYNRALRTFDNNMNQFDVFHGYTGGYRDKDMLAQHFDGRQRMQNNNQVNDYFLCQRGRGRGTGRGYGFYDDGPGRYNNNNFDNNSYSTDVGNLGSGNGRGRGVLRNVQPSNEDNRYDDGGIRNGINDNDDKQPESNHNVRRNLKENEANDNKEGFRQQGSSYNERHNGNENQQMEKRREIYIPPDRFDENTVFKCGIKAGINFSNYDDIKVNTSGEDIPLPIHTFRKANLKCLLQENIDKSKYKQPTPVQKYAFPILLANRNLMACAQTGSGKTAAFMIPIIHKLLDKSRNMNGHMTSVVEPRAVIIAPTRELTTQIYNQARKFANRSTLKCQQLYGGTSIEYQLRQLMYGCDILVATPGRLLDVMQRKKIAYNAIEFLVLDEADKMLDMGFYEDVEKIFRHETMVPVSQRQTLMFSATFPSRIQELARRYMHNYIFLSVGIIGGACTDIEQVVYHVSKRNKRGKLDELLHNEVEHNSLSGILIFVDMKKTADFIAAFLSENNFPTTSIHSDRLQREREEALEDFKSGRMAILVATAVAARGLDIENVKHVINYDLPNSIEEYVHRIGRTGRVGNRGKATSFYDDIVDSRLQEDLVKILIMAKQNVPKWLSNNCEEVATSLTIIASNRDIRNLSSTNKIKYGDTAESLESDEDAE